jgi:hypothetical protein
MPAASMATSGPMVPVYRGVPEVNLPLVGVRQYRAEKSYPSWPVLTLKAPAIAVGENAGRSNENGARTCMDR